ncbi:MAG: 50S ribosomal protein L11 methyltransferase [Gammaproteobacteria bacterium]|nr:MAG: 50S ribosomal protein L11 methyltransferase [Gammaproteobacteria bacterium]
MPWQELSIPTSRSNAEALSDLLTAQGALSVTFQDNGDQPVYEPELGKTAVWQETKVTGLFDKEADLTNLCSRLRKDFNTLPEVVVLEDQVWERSWLEHFKPMKFGEKLWICPSEQNISEAGAVVIKLDPGLAFGTGTHPTTSLCLKWLGETDVVGKTVIDYGCGSGILAVAALLLGAKKAIAVDIDPQALIATKDNAEKNGVLSRIHCFLPEQFTPQTADIVLANILAEPLIELSGLISELVAPGGQLALSGILKEQVSSVKAAYYEKLELAPTAFEEDWARITGKRILN